MPGIVFHRTQAREQVVDFYTDRLGFETWLEQEGGCTILRYDTLLLGFCDGDQTETDGIITVVLDRRAAVDNAYERLVDVAHEAPTTNGDFDIYHFFVTDPDGRTVELQAFLHPIPPL